MLPKCQREEMHATYTGAAFSHTLALRDALPISSLGGPCEATKKNDGCSVTSSVSAQEYEQESRCALSVRVFGRLWALLASSFGHQCHNS